MIAIAELVKDPYERKARVVPGLLVALPVLVPLLSVYGAQHPLLTSVIGLLAGCGAIYMLASVARGLGKKAEERLVKQWGGLPTTIALRHRDKTWDRVTKKAYHDLILSKLGIAVPTKDEESQDPEGADEVYVGATRRIRELTRSDRKLLMKENIAYGFHRNMYALRPIGILSCLAGLIYGLLIAKVMHVNPPGVSVWRIADPGLPAGLTLLISCSLLVAWLFYFNKDAVRRIGFVYAERLFECLRTLPPARPKKTTTTESQAH